MLSKSDTLLRTLLDPLRHTHEREQFWADMRASLLPAMRIVTGLVLAAALAMVVRDSLTMPGLSGLLDAKLVILLVLGIAFGISHTRWGQNHLYTVYLAMNLLILGVAVYQSSVFMPETFMIPLAAIFGTAISATLMPGPIRYHLIAVAGSIGAILVNAHWVANGRILEPNAITAITLSIASIVLAYHTHGQRFSLWRTSGALRISDERFRHLGENSHDIISIWSPATCTGEEAIEYINPAYEHFTGLPRAEVEQNWVRVINPVHVDDRPAFSQALMDIAHGAERQMDVRVIHTDGTLFHLEGWGVPIHASTGEVVRCIGIWRDVTERVQLIEELEAYAHTVAHDLKNPLSIILGFSALLEHDLTGTLDDEQAHCLHTITTTAQKMSCIIDELLLMASVRDMNEVPLETLDMGTIVANAHDRLNHQIETHQATVILPDVWPGATGYAPWVEEIWTNYISNALKYGGTPPRLEFGAHIETESGMVCYWLQDNGPGLTLAEQQRLFTEFARLDRARANGHGLGLSIVQRIAERLNGEVGLESELNRGSRFYVKLPANGCK